MKEGKKRKTARNTLH